MNTRTERLAPYMTSDPSTIVPEPGPQPEARAKPTSDRPPEGNVCEGCHLPAGQLRRIGDGPWHCEGCHERAEAAKRYKADEPIRRQHEAEMEALRASQAEAARRPDPPELTCRYGQCSGGIYTPAVGIRNGLAACESCLRGEFPGHPEALVVTLEKRVAALEATLAAQQAPRAARKAAS